MKIKTDYSRVGKAKSAVLRSLEKWVIFPNKFAAVAKICADLHAEIVNNADGFQTYKHSSSIPAEQTLDILTQIQQHADTTYKACLELSLLTPIMAEAFINMVILILCKQEV